MLRLLGAEHMERGNQGLFYWLLTQTPLLRQRKHKQDQRAERDTTKDKLYFTTLCERDEKKKTHRQMTDGR